jgi:glycosyltransferase involved in cell wall biosynthesis
MRDFSGIKVTFLAGTLEHGGAERQLFYMLQALCALGTTPRVLCFDQGEFWERPIRSLGVTVTWVGQSASRMARLIRILATLRREPPDVFQSQHFFANAYVGVASWLLPVIGIGAIRNEGSAELQGNGRIGGWLNLHLPRMIAANSRIAMEQVIQRGFSPDRLFFLPNVVDTQRFQPENRPAYAPVTLLSVGRLTRQKRFDRFISALAAVRAKVGAEVRGLIVGPPQDHGLQAELERQAKGLGLIPGHLEFHGGTDNMAAVYRRADICVLTSDYEGTPNVLLEAMASGLPVVSTKVGGVPGIVKHGQTGLLVEREDEAGLADALVSLVRDVPLRTAMGHGARDFVQAHASLQRLPGYLGELYRRALPPGHSGRLQLAGRGTA